MPTPFTAHISGNPNITTLASINVRAQPGTGTVAVLFQAAIGMDNLPILDVQPDQASGNLNGKVYQWFRLHFPNNQTGWVRDDLISIEGDGASFGYPALTQEAYAFGLLRQLLPAPAPTPAPTPPPTFPVPTPPTPTPAPTPSSDVIGVVLSMNGLNLRGAPVNGTVKARLGYLTQVKIVGTQPQGGTSNYVWANVETPQGNGWVRTDYLSIGGDGTRFNLSRGDEYAAPIQMRRYWWIRGQNQSQNPGEEDHLGWDFSANANEPVFCALHGGFVERLFTCARCTADRPNVTSQGIPLNSATVLADEAWGFGYGNAVIMRYLNNLLPASTRERLAGRGLAGAHLYVLYGHLSQINVLARQELSPLTQIGVIGNTGNSSATHLHVEVRASTNPDDVNWAAMRPREFDPSILFLR